MVADRSRSKIGAPLDHFIKYFPQGAVAPFLLSAAAKKLRRGAIAAQSSSHFFLGPRPEILRF